jgi:type III pantothenate kinase
MNLVIDRGNTFCKLYIFHEGRIVARTKVETLDIFLLDKIFKEFVIKHSIFSHVGNWSKEVVGFLLSHSQSLAFDYQTPLPFQNLYTSPETLGLDRIAAVAGAQQIFPNQHVLCIDLGTCITYDFLDAEGKYYGGAISPGLSMRLKAMHTFTAKLPLVAMESNKPAVLGDNTSNALRSGAYWGVYYELKGLIEHYQSLQPETKVLACGGDLALFDTQFKNSIFARPDLVAEGLNTILEYNARTEI